LTSINGQAGAGWQAGYYRISPDIIEMARAGATFAFEVLGATRAAAINDGDTFSRGYTGLFLQKFVELGGEVALEATANKGDEEMRPLLRTVVASGTELVFLALFPPEGACFVQQAREVTGFENINILGGSPLHTGGFLKSTGASSVGVYFMGSSPPEGATNDALLAAYEARFSGLPQTITYGRAYDTANLLLNAIETTAVQDKDGTLHIGRQALRDALYATRGWEGLTGRLTCDEFGDCATVKIDIVRLDNPAAGLEGLTSNVIYSFDKSQ
jgi:branched-chain amino acid transport system substrate-binding protein